MAASIELDQACSVVGRVAPQFHLLLVVSLPARIHFVSLSVCQSENTIRLHTAFCSFPIARRVALSFQWRNVPRRSSAHCRLGVTIW
jgi:hypothetical protein